MLILDVPQSGSVGAQTSSRNRSGQYRRQRAIPTQPRTPAQVAARSRLGTVSAAWRGLTPTQIAAWNAFALSFTTTNALGSTIHLTGSQCYTKVNTVNLQCGRSIVSVPPALPAFVAVLVTGVDATAATPLVELSGAAPAMGTTFMIFASPQLSPGVTFNGQYAFLTDTLTFTSGKAPITTAYSAKWGAPIAGKKLFIKVVQEQAGMQDNGTVFTCIVGT
jgi:hypothetical protein